MRLYHTSELIIKNPDIFHGRKNADFGQGFYLSKDYDFCRRWSLNEAFINEYELDTGGLDIIELSRNREWFEYIFGNRRLNDTIKADVIIGPIANDTIYDTFGIISSGYLSTDEALKLLMIGPEYTQVVLKSEKAGQQLKWLDAVQVHSDEDIKALLKAEEEEYQQAFADCMQSF
ncbi:MAG: DUF3990 domain-containing protein [Lachnospiraceae bacterium]|nr:DUF3990 domain-containing protein [Lachnospiraceae bacterium]